jgi:hypothetical protein
VLSLRLALYGELPIFIDAFSPALLGSRSPVAAKCLDGYEDATEKRHDEKNDDPNGEKGKEQANSKLDHI